MYTKNTIDLSEALSEDLSEALSWSLLKKSISGEDLTKLESSTTSGVTSGSLSIDDLTFVQTFKSNTKHFNTSLVTPNDLSKNDK